MDYARALVEHPMWRWEPGMAGERIGAISHVYADGKLATHEAEWSGSIVPDLSHPATKGWLLHMLREATGTQDACATWLGGEWRLYGWIGASALGRFATEGEALAAALLAVWGQAA